MSAVDRKPRVAFIPPRCGREVVGGAESLCFLIASRMREDWEVEILTSRALDYHTWRDSYPAGTEVIDGIPVKRFGVTHEKDDSFDRYCGELEKRIDQVGEGEAEAWMRRQGPCSEELLAYLRENIDAYDAFIFAPYLYATTYYGLAAVGKKGFLIPAAHDEWMIRLPIFEKMFGMPRGFIFNTEEERDLLKSLYPGIPMNDEVFGVGVDMPVDVDAGRFRSRHKLVEPYIIYAGRIDVGKGCRELFEYFIRMKERQPSDLRLVLIGKQIIDIPDRPDIIYVGRVDEQTKLDAMSGAEYLVNPSPFESLSMVLLEAWSVGVPVLVNAKCAVLVGQCRRFNGGLWYENDEEFATVLTATDKPTRVSLGRQGRAHVESNCTWDMVRSKYRSLVKTAEIGFPV